MTPPLQLVVFRINNRKFAIHLHSVERVVRAVALTAVPQAPDTVMGIINLQGKIIPVINMRQLMGISTRDLELSDQFLIVKTARWTLALWVDSVIENIDIDPIKITNPEKIFYGIKYIHGVVKSKDDLTLINDLDKFIAEKEVANLKEALKEEGEKSTRSPKKKTTRTKKRTKPKAK